MASNTENLNLLMKNPSTDGADTFNVQTMLNENWQKIDNNAGKVAQTLANILKPTTPPIIGLPSSATPDGMFQALAHAGDLHVWRKTVKNAADVPAGYTITDKTGVGSVVSNSARITISYSDAVDVDDQGNVSLREPITTETYSVPALNKLGATNPTYISGKFFTATSYNGILYRKPSASWSFGVGTDGTYFGGGFVVEGYAKVLAGTTTTYPVSTNPNAYQEGDDAKPAGYTLGDVVSGLFLAGSPAGGIHWQYSDSISVQDNGTLFFDNPSEILNAGTSTGGKLSSLLGKFARLTTNGSIPSTNPFYNGTYVYIPADATITAEIQIDRYQPVTGYAAIPANTTIEYLGCLGDKARVQVVSYVGTGTYGSSNPNSLTFDFVPKAVFLFSADTYNKCFVAYGDTTGFVFDSDATVVLHVSWNGKNISWFNTNNDLRQHNVSGYKYRAIAIG